jgi:hypothetical protein
VAIFSLYLAGVSSVSGEVNFVVTAVSIKPGTKCRIGFRYLHEPCTEFWWKNQEEGDHKEDLDVIGNSKIDLRKIE